MVICDNVFAFVADVDELVAGEEVFVIVEEFGQVVANQEGGKWGVFVEDCIEEGGGTVFVVEIADVIDDVVRDGGLVFEGFGDFYGFGVDVLFVDQDNWVEVFVFFDQKDCFFFVFQAGYFFWVLTEDGEVFANSFFFECFFDQDSAFLEDYYVEAVCVEDRGNGENVVGQVKINVFGVTNEFDVGGSGCELHFDVAVVKGGEYLVGSVLFQGLDDFLFELRKGNVVD